MELRQLRYFIAIADAGSLTEAARRLGVAQPALSQHVLALEAELQTRLLERGARGVRLTPAGLTLLEHALVVTRDVERTKEAVSAGGTELVGRVAIGLPTTVAIVLGAPLLKAAFAAYPRVHIHLVESHSGFLQEWLRSGRLDLAILFNIADADEFEVEPLLVEDIHLVSAAGTAGRKRRIRLPELEKLDLLMPARPHGLRQLLDGSISVMSGRMAPVRAEIDALPTLKRMVQAGLGHTIFPLAAVIEELAAGTLIARKIVDPVLERHVALVSSSRRPRTRVHQAIAELIDNVSRQLIADGAWPGREAGSPRERQ